MYKGGGASRLAAAAICKAWKVVDAATDVAASVCLDAAAAVVAPVGKDDDGPVVGSMVAMEIFIV